MAKILPERSKKRLEFSVHPAALSAFNFFQSQNFLFNKMVFNGSIIEQINVGLTLHAVEKSDTHIEIISGFESITFSMATLRLKQHDVILHRGLSDEDIALRSWKGVLRAILTSIHPKNLESFRRSFNSDAPPDVIELLCKKSQLSQKALAELASVSRSALALQHTKIGEESMDVSDDDAPPSIFEILVKERNDEF